MSLRTIAVIPVHGRLPLLAVTIDRLYNRNKVDHVICVGGTSEEAFVCNKHGAEFLIHKNKPLGRKWNAGYELAGQYKPDAIVYVGSSDWLSDNWIDITLPFIGKGYALIGKRDYYILHIDKNGSMEAGWWPCYPEGARFDPREFIGIGRVLGRNFLEPLAWRPFEDTWNSGMDFAMWNRVGLLQKHGLIEKPVYEISGNIIQSLSISCDSWNNMHSSDVNSDHVRRIEEPEIWLKRWFPEALTLKI